MQFRQLGMSDMAVSPIGLGTWAIGGEKWDWGWGPQSDEDATQAMEIAIENGINWIDTAPVYGLGHAEEMVGAFLRKRKKSQWPLVFTKCSIVWDDVGALSHNLSAASIQVELENSLRRLGTERIDLYQIHWPCYPPDSPDHEIEPAIETLLALRRAGKIREIGVSNFSASQIERALRVGPIVCVQPPYSLINRASEVDPLPFCGDKGVGAIVYSPLASGLLTGAMTRERIAALPDTDWRKTQGDEFQEPQLTRNLRIVDCLREVAARHDVPVAAVALAWVLQNHFVTGAIVGIRRPAQIDDILPASHLNLKEEDSVALAKVVAS